MENAKKITVDKYSKGVQFVSILGIIIGAVTIGFGAFYCGGSHWYATAWDVEAASFGADFYTYLYDAVYSISQNMYTISGAINYNSSIMGCLIIFFGCFEILLFSFFIANNKKKTIITIEENSEKPINIVNN